MTTNHPSKNDFDEYAADYDAALTRGISASGEDREFFAHGRVAWLANCLSRLQEIPVTVLDFGCGTGSSVPFLFTIMKISGVMGVDVSQLSLEVAKRNNAGYPAKFLGFDEYMPDASFDLAFCNGVFHHIPIAERAAAIQYIYRSLKPGGLFALWENNPWNPGTRYVMSRITFDRDAIPLSAEASKRLLREGGFDILRTDFLFIFPKMLKLLRPIEAYVSRLPLGAQYQVLSRKPGGGKGD